MTETAPGVTAPLIGAFFTGVAAERDKDIRGGREGGKTHVVARHLV